MRTLKAAVVTKDKALSKGATDLAAQQERAVKAERELRLPNCVLSIRVLQLELMYTKSVVVIAWFFSWALSVGHAAWATGLGLGGESPGGWK